MSKTLFLVRHAKSGWKDSGMPDFDRPLNERGLRNAPMMGKVLHARGIRPELWVSSPAKRAYSTATLIAEAMDIPVADIEKVSRLYEASVQDWLDTLCALDNRQHSAILFGHNPGITDFSNYLSNGAISHFPTCGIAEITFDTDNWQEISKDSGTLRSFDFPKNYPEGY